MSWKPQNGYLAVHLMIYVTKAVKHRRHRRAPVESVSAGLSPQGLWYVLPRALSFASLHAFRHQRRRTLLLKKLPEVVRMITKVSKVVVSSLLSHLLQTMSS